MLRAPLFAMAKNGQGTKCPLPSDWLNTLWYIDIMHTSQRHYLE